MTKEATASILEIVADSDGVLERLRGQGAVAQVETGPLVVSYDAVRKVMQDTRLAANFPAVLELFGVNSGAFYDFMSSSPLNREGEDHRRWRSLMTKTFTPTSVDRLRPYMRAESERLLATFVDAEHCEFIEAFARQLPSLGLCELVGVPKEDRPIFCDWADTIGLGFNQLLLAERIEEVNAATTSLLDYSRELVRKRMNEPQDDLVSRLAKVASEEDGNFDEDIMTMSVAGLVFAGHETTKNQLGWMLVVLSEVPEQWDRVAANPERARGVIEEVLRLRSAVTAVGRTATEELAIGDTPIPAGSRLIASLWSANRDQSVFPRPEVVDIEHNLHNPQLAFGQGIHHCLGAALARTELQEALVALSAAITCPRIEPGAEFLPPIGIAGPTRLPIRFTKR